MEKVTVNQEKYGKGNDPNKGKSHKTHKKALEIQTPE
jgi:hypothetical protein